MVVLLLLLSLPAVVATVATAVPPAPKVAGEGGGSNHRAERQTLSNKTDKQ